MLRPILDILATGAPPSPRGLRGLAAVLLVVCLGVPAEGRCQVNPDTAVAQMASGPPVQPGDLIRLKVWREPELTGDVVVDAQGNATLPRLGATPVAGMSADSLRRLIVNTYIEFLRDPAVDVMVLPRVTILGAVRNPGVHNVEPTMTIGDALALAGGAAPQGKQDQVELRRRGERVPVRLSLDARFADTPIRSGDQLVVPERSWIGRNAGLLMGVASLGISVIYLVGR